MSDAYLNYRQGLDAMQAGHPDEAIAPLERARHLEPHSNSILEALGKAYLEVGFLDRAISAFEEIVDRDPVDAYAQFCLARACDRAGATERARHHYRLATWFDPTRTIYRDTLKAFLARSAGEDHDIGGGGSGPMVFGD